MGFLHSVWFGNTLLNYSISLLVFLGIWLLGRPVLNVLLSRIGKLTAVTPGRFDDVLMSEAKSLPLWVYFSVGLFVGSRWVMLPPRFEKIIYFIFIVALTVAAVQFLTSLTKFFLQAYYGRKHGDNGSVLAATDSLLSIIRVVLWLGGLLFLLDNLGFNITTLVAGLGIGGVAVALAAQAVLGDLFSSFSIYLDKPFQIGDFIIVGDMMGNVEHIGIKTTRVRSLSGEQLVFANSDLTNSRIRNYKRMSERRILFTIGLTYSTTAEQLKKTPQIVKEVFESIDNARLDRVHFSSFGDFSLNFEIVYYVRSPDYNTYMDIQQQVNLALKEKIEGIGAEFAFPTQTVYVQKES